MTLFILVSHLSVLLLATLSGRWSLCLEGRRDAHLKVASEGNRGTELRTIYFTFFFEIGGGVRGACRVNNLLRLVSMRGLSSLFCIPVVSETKEVLLPLLHAAVSVLLLLLLLYFHLFVARVDICGLQGRRRMQLGELAVRDQTRRLVGGLPVHILRLHAVHSVRRTLQLLHEHQG